MSTRPELVAQRREVTGKAVARLRRAGQLPAVVYGHGHASESLQIDAREFDDLRRHTGRNALLDLKVDGGTAQPVMVHGVAGAPRHAAPAARGLLPRQDDRGDDRRRADRLTCGESVGGGEARRQRCCTCSTRSACAPCRRTCRRPSRWTSRPLDTFEAMLHVSDLRVPERVTILTDGDEAAGARPAAARRGSARGRGRGGRRGAEGEEAAEGAAPSGAEEARRPSSRTARPTGRRPPAGLVRPDVRPVGRGVAATRSSRPRARQALRVDHRARRPHDGRCRAARSSASWGPTARARRRRSSCSLGLSAADRRRRRVLGRPLGDLAARRRVGYLPELFRYQAWLSGRELLRLPLPPGRACHAASTRRPSHDALAIVGPQRPRRATAWAATPRACSSGWGWRRPCSGGRSWSSWTSRPRPSTRSGGWRCGRSSAACASGARPSSSTRTC